jgi:hypothetical protein
MRKRRKNRKKNGGRPVSIIMEHMITSHEIQYKCHATEGKSNAVFPNVV